ncbi:MAG: transglutaminase-like domain-containing protein [Balneolales bacterium]|nr:transglutaminase-like domain-containing protein [Balneolales bacterium]
MKPLNSEIESLIYLLEDPDDFIQEQVIQRLTQIGESAVPLLDQKRVTVRDADTRLIFDNLIHTITYHSFQQDVALIANDGIYTIEDLEDAVFLFSRFDNPTIRMQPFSVLLDQMADEIALKLRKAETDRKKMQIFLQYLYSQKQFEGCQNEYLHPHHSYIHHVLKNKKGIPLSLAFVILFLARRLHLPFFGINMPLHFLVKYVTVNNDHVLVDPFNNGSVLSREQCQLFLRKSGIKFYDQYFEVASPYAMFSRFVRNLINGYTEMGKQEKARQLQELFGQIESLREL